MSGVRKGKLILSASKSFVTNVTEMEKLPLVETHHDEIPATAAITMSYNEKIRPVLDAVEDLRRLNITKEGIQLPTIVVVGDQSSGKSSVLESLAGISLPRGQGICTRVPLIMRLQHHSVSEPNLSLEYNGKSIATDEEHVSDAINIATEELAGHGKGICNTPLTLIVKKQGVPDLTMVDLPGITRVPVQGQPENIYDQIKDMIMDYVKPEESIILNVLSASVDFTTCESIRMSQSVDKSGDRTLAVVTKCDKSPEGLLEKVTADDVNIGLGYVCVRNRIGDESYVDARKEEVRLFESHRLLSKIDKSIVGVPVLAQKLVQIQAGSISKNLPEMVKKINDKLNGHLSELNRMPKKMSSVADAMTGFMRVIGLSKDSLKKILIRGEYDEYPEETHMHCTARIVEMLDKYSHDLQRCSASDPTKDFLIDEIKVLEECKWIGLPNFLPRTAFMSILKMKMREIDSIPIGFVEKLWSYVEEVIVTVLLYHSESYHLLQMSTQRAAHNLIAKMKDSSVRHVRELLEMEKLTDYTCQAEYMINFNDLMSKQESFLAKVFKENHCSSCQIEGVGDVEVGALRRYPRELLQQAFDLKMRMIAYWKIVTKRLIDCIALHLRYNIDNLVNKELEVEIVNDLMTAPGNSCLERLLDESPSVAGKREMLNKSIIRLRESKAVVGHIMDSIRFGDY